MFLILLRYIQPLTEIDLHVEAHRHFLEENYAKGNFLLSGRQELRSGGFVLSRISERSEVEKIIQRDPFYIHKLAEYSIIEIVPSRASHELAHLIPPTESSNQ